MIKMIKKFNNKFNNNFKKLNIFVIAHFILLLIYC